MRITLLHIRPLSHEHHGTKACNDAHARPTLRPRSAPPFSGPTSRCPGGDRSATWAMSASLPSSCGGAPPGCTGSAGLCHPRRRAPRPCTTRPSTKAWPHGRMMARSGRRVGPVCGISRLRSRSLSAYSRAMGSTPWPQRRRWHGLLGIPTPEGRDGHCHHRHPGLGVSARPRGARP